MGYSEARMMGKLSPRAIDKQNFCSAAVAPSDLSVRRNASKVISVNARDARRLNDAVAFVGGVVPKL